MKKLKYLLPILLLLISCKIQKSIYNDCEMPGDKLGVDEYVKALESWEECLVLKRIKEKNKKELYKDISGNDIHLGILEGIELKVSENYLSFRALSKILTDNELNQNLYSEDPAIKYHSFLTIAERNKQNVFDALKIVLHDTTPITTQFACIGEETTLADLCIEQVTEKYFKNYESYKPNKYQLTLEEKDELDKLVLNSKMKLKYRAYLEK